MSFELIVCSLFTSCLLSLKKLGSSSSPSLSDLSIIAQKPAKRPREATIQRPKPSVSSEARTQGVCSVCNKSGVILYKKQGEMVCGSNECYHDSVLPLNGPRKRKKREKSNE